MHLVLVSTYPPRRCGLATFAADLRTALRAAAPRWRVDVCAIDWDGSAYGPAVTRVLAQDHRDGYRPAARAVAASGADLVVIQHEFGIFGGPHGAYLLDFTDELTRLGVPYAVTLHTVLSAPPAGPAAVLAALLGGAALATVFTGSARTIATRSGVVDPGRVVVVPHGVPARLGRPVAPAELGPAVAAALAAVAGNRVLSTFGLLRPGKGLETVIAALPEVVSRHPDVRYLIAGATHPEVVRTSGESYRTGLVGLARELGVAEQVRFVDTFLSEPELAALLDRTLVHLTPYRSVEQTCSGVLTFALAAGCAVVSTSYRYAIDLVTPPDGPPRGALVPFDDPAAFATAVGDLLADPLRLAAARAAARQVGTELTWPAVGRRFATVFTDAVTASRAASRVRSAARMRTARLHDRVGELRVPNPLTAGGEPAWSDHPQPPAPTSPAP
jgi:glycosyltransferase involved in cell wall biosynthesis